MVEGMEGVCRAIGAVAEVVLAVRELSSGRGSSFSWWLAVGLSFLVTTEYYCLLFASTTASGICIV